MTNTSNIANGTSLESYGKRNRLKSSEKISEKCKLDIDDQ